MTTGVDIHFKYGLKNEIIDLKNTDNQCDSLINSHNLTITSGAVGGVIDEFPIICGGRNLDGDAEQNCTIMKKERNIKFKMLEKRVDASCVLLNKTTLWIVGGTDLALSMHNSTEFIKVGHPPIKGPYLPFSIKNHCMVQINESTIFIIGGYVNKQRNESSLNKEVSKKTWIIDSTKDFQVREGPSLNVFRSGHACSKFEIDGKYVVIVVGGYVSSNWLESVEILDMSSSLVWNFGNHTKTKYYKSLFSIYY